MAYRYSDYLALGNLTPVLVQKVPLKRGARVLDVGSGDALNAMAYARDPRVARVMGIELVKSWVEEARETAKKEGLGDKLELQVNDFYQNGFGAGSFDAVTFFIALTDVAHAPEDLGRVFTEAHRLLSKGGLLVLCEEFEEDAKSAAERVGFALNRALGYHYFPFKTVEEKLNAAGFEVAVNEDVPTGRNVMDEKDLEKFVDDEVDFYEDLYQKSLDGKAICQKFLPEVKAHGFVVDARVRLLVAQKR